MNHFYIRYPNVMVISESTERLSNLETLVVQLGAKCIHKSPSLQVLFDPLVQKTSLVLIDISAFKNINQDMFRIMPPTCKVVLTGAPKQMPFLWQLLLLGIDDYIPDTISITDFHQRMLDLPADPLASTRAIARSWVGYCGVKDIQSEVRSIMYKEALNRTGGNKVRAARLLNVTRGAVQKELRGY